MKKIRIGLLVLVPAILFRLISCSTEISDSQVGSESENQNQVLHELILHESDPEAGIATAAPEMPAPRIENHVIVASSSMRSGALMLDSFAPNPQYALMESPIVGHEVDRFRFGRPVDRENYDTIESNPVKIVATDPVSTFSIDVDTASYSNIRRMLSNEGRLPPSDAVRIEELINYFNYDYAAATSEDQPFSIDYEVAPAPWNSGRHLLQIGIKGYEPEVEERPDANLVFLVDVSGSMSSPDKLPLVKRSLEMLSREMRDEDRIAIVVYAGAAGVVLDSTSGDDRSTIVSALNRLQSGGSTNGGEGIRLAYSIAEDNFIEGGINRVIIASDGDMNVGTVNVEALKDLVQQKKKTGVSLTTLGFGTGNYNDHLMEQIADVGNGNAAYIDSLQEARKVLVTEMQSTLMTIAKDVKIQIEFNPKFVSQYRLIGYENRVLQNEDFLNDKVDAGEIGAGHTVTALYEIALVGTEDIGDGRWTHPLRYDQTEPNSVEMEANPIQGADELAYVRVRHKQPESDVSSETGLAIPADSIVGVFEEATLDFRFAVSVAAFGDLLRGGENVGNWSYDDVVQAVRDARGEDSEGYRSELLQLVGLAKSFSGETQIGKIP